MQIFKKRKLVVTMAKEGKDKTSETRCTPQDFEKKAEIILHKLESLGAKMFLGVIVFVLLDTRRQVEVAKATHPR